VVRQATFAVLTTACSLCRRRGGCAKRCSADQPGPGGVVEVVGAVDGQAAQRFELGLDAVQPGAVVRGVGDLDVVVLPTRGPDRRVRAEVVMDDAQPALARVERADAATEREELDPSCAF
jgi:hypothetical protein